MIEMGRDGSYCPNDIGGSRPYLTRLVLMYVCARAVIGIGEFCRYFLSTTAGRLKRFHWPFLASVDVDIPACDIQHLYVSIKNKRVRRWILEGAHEICLRIDIDISGRRESTESNLVCRLSSCLVTSIVKVQSLDAFE